MARAARKPATRDLRLLLLMLAYAPLAAAPAAAQQPSTEELAEMSLEELGAIEVTSVSRRAQRLTEAAASVYVISGEDIRRSGVTSLPELLRLAPNLEVARTGAATHAISARGFNNAIGNKLQVLMDGRILYNPLFSGMFWDAHDLVLDDIERIEVVSGPGSTLWGANAVTGVINIITRAAGATRGGHVRIAGSGDERIVAARYGFGDERRALRLSAKGVERDATQRASGVGIADEFRGGSVALRADWVGDRDHVRLGAGTHRGRADSVSPDDTRMSSSHLSLEWRRTLEGDGALRVQGYLDWRFREVPGSIGQHLRIADVEFQHDVGGLERHRLAWGASHRSARDRVDVLGVLAFLPPQRHLRWTSAYVQDEVAIGNAWRVTGGLRLEHNTYTGLEVLPSLRLAWVPSESRLLWGALTRAVRTPSRFDRDLFAPAQPPFLIAGGPDFRSEVALISEVGYRARPNARWSWSVTAFHHDYRNLRTFEMQPGGGFVIGNGMVGIGRGLEAWASLQATPRWRLHGGMTLLDQDLRIAPGSTDLGGTAAAGNDPRVQWQLRSNLDLPHHLELDVGVRHVGELPSPRVPAYTAVDLRLGWRPTPRLELSLQGRNLGGGHVEFGNPLTSSEFDREVEASLRWTF
jgi:iron complex outermembrane receptor protein